MGALDVFALIVLLVLAAAAVGAWVALAVLPGRIAAQRGHPQADAIRVCGWWGALTLGLLMPLAFIWAYTRPGAGDAAPGQPAADDRSEL